MVMNSTALLPLEDSNPFDIPLVQNVSFEGVESLLGFLGAGDVLLERQGEESNSLNAVFLGQSFDVPFEDCRRFPVG